MAGPNPKIRRAGPDDDPAIRSLLAEVFPANIKARAEVMTWQYWDNPFGAAHSWVAEDDGRIVAHYAGIALPGVLGGEAVTFAMGVDAATAPTHRGLGLFEQLARAVYLDCGQAGMPVTYCLPNPNSLRGFQKAGGQEVGRARVLVAPLDDAWAAGRFHVPTLAVRAARRTAFRLPADEAGCAAEAPPEGLDGLWATVAPSYPYSVARHGAWWSWRYGQRPERPYLFAESRASGRLEAAAAAMVREDLGGRFLCLLELMAVDRRAARRAVAALVRSAGVLGVVGVAATALSGSPHYRLATAAGLRPLPRRFEPQPMHVGVVDNAGTRPGLTGARWSMSWGDLDHL
ncbi:MAG TPA: GNAT family N-acetyltransferase [Acidimicrobiales bacterium]|nr:GNAT family N-acetyltransferase [Acidimicrobiales bacterium]